MPSGDKINHKTTREHLLDVDRSMTSIKKDVKSMNGGIHDLGGKIETSY